MRYPIFIEEGSEDTAFGVVVPDLPGCFSAGDTLEEALDAAKEAAAGWIDAALDNSLPIPQPSSLSDLRMVKDYAGWTIGVVELDSALFDDHIERVNITLPNRVLRRLDDLAAQKHQSRGALISDMTLGVGMTPVSGRSPAAIDMAETLDKLTHANELLEGRGNVKEASRLIRDVFNVLLEQLQSGQKTEQDSSDLTRRRDPKKSKKSIELSR